MTTKTRYGSGVNTRISQGEYGNLSVAESCADLTKAAAEDEVILFELPEGVRIYGIRLYCSGAITIAGIKAGEHKLTEEVAVNGNYQVTPWTNDTPNQRIIMTLKTVPAITAGSTVKLTCVIEYVAQGSL